VSVKTLIRQLILRIIKSRLVHLHVSRDQIKKAVEDNGGKNGSSISSKTDFVVAGADMGPAKLEKATKLKIPILSEQDFMAMISQ